MIIHENSILIQMVMLWKPVIYKVSKQKIIYNNKLISRT